MSFEIPAGAIANEADLVECSNCHSPAPAAELAHEGICRDCQQAVARARALANPAPAPEAFTLPVDAASTPDELAARRRRRQDVRDAAVPVPQGWVQHAIEAVREECVRARSGHEFTIDTILDQLEKKAAPMPAASELQGAHALRFVMEEAVSRGWCEATDRRQPSRRDETSGRQNRVYRSLL